MNKKQLMEKYFMDFSVKVDDISIQKLNVFLDILLEENKIHNLTSLTGVNEIIIKHFIDSLAITKTAWWFGERIIDIGSGPGFPGIPLSVVFPEREIFLVESNKKKVTFLKKAKDKLKLDSLHILKDRAELLAHNPAYRESFHLVLARAVAELPSLLELTLPFCAINGLFVAYKGPKGLKELEDTEQALTMVGAEFTDYYYYNLPDNMGEHYLLAFKKTTKTPDRFPRRPGIPVKRPLL